MEEINQATDHLMHCIAHIGYALNKLHENEENSDICTPDIPDRIDELDAILDYLDEVQTYLENTDFTA